MTKLSSKALEMLTKTAFSNAKKEANSACICIGYQPEMPEKVKQLCKKTSAK